jgi:hypothetical protein
MAGCPKLKDSGARREFSTGAVRDAAEGKGRYDLLPFQAIERLAQVYEAGALKYDDENWRKGIPCRKYLDSALRHLCKHGQGRRDEDHLAQALWNICGLIETEFMVSQGILPAELADMPDWYNPHPAVPAAENSP